MKVNRFVLFVVQVLALFTLVAGYYVFGSGRDFQLKTAKPATASSQSSSLATEESSEPTSETETAPEDDFPEVSLDDWELILVNRDNMLAELSPELAQVGPIMVDARIAEATANFLAAAQTIDVNEHLISGYRRLAEQEVIYNNYINQEMANGLSAEAAIQQVQTYSQPPGASEHQTGLAIDMSTVDALNQSDPQVVAQVAALAPEYGFVLRFPEGKQDVTGIGYEDWHFRYVGVDSAKYMSAKQLTLEEYIQEIRSRTQ